MRVFYEHKVLTIFLRDQNQMKYYFTQE